jgi:hypothetical protein
MNSSLYLGGTFEDVNLSTVAGRSVLLLVIKTSRLSNSETNLKTTVAFFEQLIRGSAHRINVVWLDRDKELAALEERYSAGWFDMWRTDTFTAPENPVGNTFASTSNFLHIVDTMISLHPGFRYENCANGGCVHGKRLLRCHFIPKRSFYLDRLGTNIGKVEKREAFFAGTTRVAHEQDSLCCIFQTRAVSISLGQAQDDDIALCVVNVHVVNVDVCVLFCASRVGAGASLHVRHDERRCRFVARVPADILAEQPRAGGTAAQV